MVDPSAGLHTHEMKTCKGKCGKLKPADAFGLHQSSTDGRRHVCLECVADSSAAGRVHRAVEKDKQFRDDRKSSKNIATVGCGGAISLDRILSFAGYCWIRRGMR